MPPSGSDGLFAGVFARGGAREEVGDRAWVQGMLDFEAALAHASARAGVPLPPGAADAIAAECRAERYDAAELGRRAAGAGNPAVPLVRALTERVPADAAGWVHLGATSQDALDTAAMLVARRALGPIVADVAGAAEAAARLAEAHRGTVLAGRTLLQQALPVTFGLKAAGWLAGLDEAGRDLAGVRERVPAVQLGGAVGTLAALGDRRPGGRGRDGRAARAGGAARSPGTRSARARPRSPCALGVAAGVLAKVARDIVLLAQTEVGEAAEAAAEGRGGSSTMPHKRNPVAAVATLACAERVPGLVATMLGAMAQEHERAAGAWHAEWETLSALLRLVGSAAAWLRDALEGLEVDAGAMRANLDRTGGLLMAESVTTRLVPALGRLRAHELVRGGEQTGGGGGAAAARRPGRGRAGARAPGRGRGGGGARARGLPGRRRRR